MIFRLLLSLLLFVCSAVSFAQSPAKFEKLTNTSGVQLFYPVGTAPAGAGQLIWDRAVNNDGGQPRVGGTGAVRNPSGGSVPVNGSTRVPGAGVSGAIGRAIPKILGRLAGPLVVGVELYDLGREIGFELSKDSAGQLGVQKLDSSICTVSPCYEWLPFAGMNGAPQPWTYSPGNACAMSVGRSWGGVDIASASYLDWQCTFYRSSGAVLSNWAPPYRDATPASSNLVPSTYQDFLDAIASKSGWPSSSKLAPVLRDSLELVPSPAIGTGPITVAGPSSSSGPTTTTVNTTNNTTTTSVTTHNHTYQGDTVTTTSTVINNTINNTTGDTIETTTTNISNPVTPPAESDYSTSDVPLPDLPILYQPKYPTGLVGVWTQKKAALLATPLASLLPQLMPSVGSVGSCPSWMLDLSLGAWSYGSYNVAPPCYIWDWAKFFVIAGALLLARALIFGG